MNQTELESWLLKIRTSTIDCLTNLNFAELEEPLYAMAFWWFYCDQTVIHPPTMAINTPSGIEQDGDWSSKWCPPEWKMDVVAQFTDQLLPLYLEFSDALKGHDEDFWDKVYNKHYELFCSICRELTERQEEYFPALSRTDSFLIAIIEDQHGEDAYRSLLLGSVAENHRTRHPDLFAT